MLELQLKDFQEFSQQNKNRTMYHQTFFRFTSTHLPKYIPAKELKNEEMTFNHLEVGGCQQLHIFCHIFVYMCVWRGGVVVVG